MKAKVKGGPRTRTETVRVMLTVEEDKILRERAHRLAGGNSSEYIRRVLFGKDELGEHWTEGIELAKLEEMR